MPQAAVFLKRHHVADVYVHICKGPMSGDGQKPMRHGFQTHCLVFLTSDCTGWLYSSVGLILSLGLKKVPLPHELDQYTHSPEIL